MIAKCLGRELFIERYSNVYEGPQKWKDISVQRSGVYNWRDESTYVKHPPYFDNMGLLPEPSRDILAARPLLLLGDSITTDHISPAGAIQKEVQLGNTC